MNKLEFLSNPGNMYYGHGVGRSGENNIDVAESIMEYGLRCSHDQLYYTSCLLGYAGSISKETINMLDNWGHLDSKIIMVISLPLNYKILDAGNSYGKGDSAFYYVPSAEMLKKNRALTNSPYVRPEFIEGYYNANTQEFTPNPRYYENLSLEEQEALFDKVKQTYYDVVNEGWGFNNYYELMHTLEGWKDMEFPLSDEEIEKFNLAEGNKKRVKICEAFLSSCPEELKNKKMITPTGEVTLEEYVKNIYFPYIPLDGKVTLYNNVVIPVSHYILEVLLYVGQKSYNGDIEEIIKNTVIMEPTEELDSKKGFGV